MSSTDKPTPKARREELVVTDVENELVVYDLKRFKAHRLNPTSASVWKACNGNRSIAEIAQLLTGEFGSTVDEQVVSYALKRLQGSYLLETPLELPAEAKRITRREMVGILGLAVMALPVITSIVVPRAADAQSCLPDDAPCSLSSNCCCGTCFSGSCCPSGV